MGKESVILVNEVLSKGTYETTWDASSFSSGIYFYKIEVSESNKSFSDVKRMLLVK